MRHCFTFLLVSLLVPPCMFAQDPIGTQGVASAVPLGYMPEAQQSGAMQASNILNPNVSAIGWFQAETGHRNPGPGDSDEDGDSFQMKEVELGFQQLSELIPLSGIDVIGPLPPAIQIVTTFSAGVCARSTQAGAVHRMLDFMTSPLAADAIRRHAMEPA